MLDQQLQQIQQLIGQLASKITEIDYEWYMIFLKIMHQVPVLITNSLIGHRASTGEAQRQLILAIANVVFSTDSEELKFLGRINKKTTELVARRNDAVHSIIFIGVLTPRIHAVAVAKRSKLSGKDILAELNSCLTEAGVIMDMLSDFESALPEREWPTLEPIQPSAGWSNPL